MKPSIVLPAGSLLQDEADFDQQVASVIRESSEQQAAPALAAAHPTARKPPIREIAWNDPDCNEVPAWLQDSYPACRPSSGELGRVTFDDKTTALSNHARLKLESIAAILRQNASMHVELNPMTTAGKPRKAKREMATSRAKAVQRHLRRLGVSAARLQIGLLDQGQTAVVETLRRERRLATGLVAVRITTAES